MASSVVGLAALDSVLLSSSEHVVGGGLADNLPAVAVAVSSDFWDRSLFRSFLRLRAAMVFTKVLGRSECRVRGFRMSVIWFSSFVIVSLLPSSPNLIV